MGLTDPAQRSLKKGAGRSSATAKRPRASVPKRSNGDFKGRTWPLHEMPTMDDIAEASGYSQMTVSRAFLKSASIRSETRDRILTIAAEIGYYPNRAASTLASQRSRAVGIILPTLQDSIYLSFVAGAGSVFEAHNIDYLLQSIDYAKGRETHAIATLLSQRVQAILLPSIGHTAETARLLQTLPIPLIEVGNLPRKPLHFAVGHSDFEASYVATKRLIERGRRKIAIICGHTKKTTNALDRLNGYRRAMQEASLEFSERRVAEVEHAVDDGLEGLGRLSTSRKAFDALVIGGEIWSAAVLLKILGSGLRVPEDVAVVGIGEAELGAYLPVPLTYVALPRRETGVRSAELALALSRGEPVAKAVTKLPVELVVNASG